MPHRRSSLKKEFLTFRVIGGGGVNPKLKKFNFFCLFFFEGFPKADAIELKQLKAFFTLFLRQSVVVLVPQLEQVSTAPLFLLEPLVPALCLITGRLLPFIL